MDHAATPLGFDVLTTLIALPAVGALLIALVSRQRPEINRQLAFIFSLLPLLLAAWVLFDFESGEAGFQYAHSYTWLESLGVGWRVGVDGISLFMVVLTAVLFPIAIAGADPHHDHKPYFAWLLLLEAGCLGVFLSLDLFMFFVMFEIVLVPMYFLIGGWGYAERVYAALKFFIFTMVGSAFMLVGIVALAFLHRDAVAEDSGGEVAAIQEEADAAIAELEEEFATLDPTDPDSAGRIGELQEEAAAIQEDADARIAAAEDPNLTFDLVEIAEAQHVADDSSSANPLDWSAARWLFLAFAVAFAVKVPLFPLHTWLPDAHTQAPTAGSVILAGVLLKLGTYGFVRFGLYLFPEATTFFAPAFVTLGVIGIIYGAVVATMQKDLKRLVAYSSVAHLGFIALGTFALTTQGLQGSVLQMVNHGISTGALFLLVGMIYDRRHTREIAALKGLQKSAPILAGVFTLVMLSSIGLPGLNGFVGELLILVGSFLTRRWWAVVAAAGVILAALYLLWAYQRVFHGEPDAENEDVPDLTWKEGLVMAPLVGLIVFLGVYPKPVLERIEPAVAELVTHIEDHSDFVEPEVATAGAPEGDGHAESGGSHEEEGH